MKKIVLSGFILVSFFRLEAQNYYMTSPEGFGAGTTGGGEVAPVTVSTYNDLKTQITSPSPAVILVSGTITIPDGGQISAVITNKTIIGLPGARLVNNTQTQSGSGILNLDDGSNNVIIRNLIFEGPGAYDTDGRDNLTADGCTNLWVDHCEFRDGVDGNYDNKGNTDNVTISWCKFTYLQPPTSGGPGGTADHRFTNLVGSGSSDAPADGHFSITFQNCYWANGCRERMPRARNGELHILNCYYNTDVSGSVALGLGGGINNLTCYVENTDFANISNVYKSYGSDGGTVSLTFIDCLNGVSDVGTVTKPSYSYTVLPVDEVAAYIPNPLCGAGATLHVTAEGVISTLCDSSVFYNLTSITSGTGEGNINVHPTSDTYQPGTIVTLTATPDPGSIFAGWSGAVTGTTNTATVTMYSDTSVTAEFELNTGIRETIAGNVMCYPTLVDQTLSIEFSNIGVSKTTIAIYSISGHKVIERSIIVVADNKIELNLSSLAKGMYFCYVQINDMVIMQKLIKQ